MIVRTLEIRLFAPWCHSLKEKRMIVRGLIDQLSHRFRISVAEADQQDVHETIVIGIAYLSANAAQADSMMESIIAFIENHCKADITDVIQDAYE